MRAACAQLPLLLFPCLNPWGLVNNSASNAHGLDLNRALSSRRPAGDQRGASRSSAPHHFAAALMLHEDYDGAGRLPLRNPAGAAVLGRSAARRGAARICRSIRARASTGARRRRDSSAGASTGGASRAWAIRRRSGCTMNMPRAPSPSRRRPSLRSSGAWPRTWRCSRKPSGARSSAGR